MRDTGRDGERECHRGNVVNLNGENRVKNIKEKKKTKAFLQILTITVVAVSRREFDSHNLLQVVGHAHSSEWWSEVNLIGLSLWTIRVIGHLVSSSDVLHHSCSKQERQH